MAQIIIFAIVFIVYAVIIFLKFNQFEMNRIAYLTFIGIFSILFWSIVIFDSFNFYVRKFDNNFKVKNYLQSVTIQNDTKLPQDYLFYILTKENEWRILYPDKQFELNFTAFSPIHRIHPNIDKKFNFIIDFTACKKIYIQKLQKGTKLNGMASIAKSVFIPNSSIFLYSSEFKEPKIRGSKLNFTFEIEMFFMHILIMIILIFHLIMSSDIFYLKLTKFILFPIIIIINSYFIYNFGKIFYHYFL